MTRKLGVSAYLLATAAFALTAATVAAAGNPHSTYTCTKAKKNGVDVRVSVPEAGASGLTDAGFTCVVEETAGEDYDQGTDEQVDEDTDETDDGTDQGGDEGRPTDSTPTDEPGGDPGGTGDPGNTGAPGNTGDPGDDTTSEDDAKPLTGERWFSVAAVEPPSESRSLYCSTAGQVERNDVDGAGIALDLPDSEGALLVEKGLATPAIFYEGVGASCDILPGFTDSGTWVDHVGNATDDGVYPYFVPASS